MLLNLQGLRTRAFRSAEAFLDACAPDWAGCVLVDLRMPGKSGLELQQELAALSVQTDRPVTTVMITNSVEEAILLSDRIVPILSGPPATLGVPIPVELPRPRSVAQLADACLALLESLDLQQVIVVGNSVGG